eukprot:2128088-Pleurochrysis_carterae.AAC.2
MGFVHVHAAHSLPLASNASGFTPMNQVALTLGTQDKSMCFLTVCAQSAVSATRAASFSPLNERTKVAAAGCEVGFEGCVALAEVLKSNQTLARMNLSRARADGLAVPFLRVVPTPVHPCKHAL